ncbi:MAG: DNA primase [Deltaproteobacteria bacterium]|nr:DNA primase [Deltaproteobacteria bacterium]
MKGHIPEEIIEEIKTRAQIVDIVSEYISLKQAGKNYVGLCPFHQEKTPSFSINPEKQIFYCFGCGEGGNAISFIMKINNMSFPESVRHLADRLGIPIPVKELTAQQRETAGERETLCRINRLAANYFSRNLASGEGKEAARYLFDRGIGDAVIKEFGLGYAYEGWNSLMNFLAGNRVSLETAEKVGLIASNAKGRHYDRFRGRIMFPIEDMNGRVIGFGGRVIGKGEPKYMNSPESPVYVKRKTLYGLYRSRNEIQKRNEAVIVEGYFDFLALWAAGITNVVATLGTALTKEQIGLIRRLTKNVAMVFDPDEAGKSAVERGVAISLEEAMNARIVMLPEGDDPDTFVRKYGKDAFEDVVREAPSMVNYYIDHMIGGGTTFADKLASARDSIGFIRKIVDPVQRNLFVKMVAEKLGIDQEVLKSEVGRMAEHRRVTTQKTMPGKSNGVPIDGVEASLIGMIIDDPGKIRIIMDENIVDYFLSKELRSLAEFIIDSFVRGRGKQLSDIIMTFPDAGVRDRFFKIAMMEKPDDQAVVDRVFMDTIKKIRRRWYKSRRDAVQRQLLRAQQAGDTALLNRLVAEKGRLLEEEKNLTG